MLVTDIQLLHTFNFIVKCEEFSFARCSALFSPSTHLFFSSLFSFSSISIFFSKSSHSGCPGETFAEVMFSSFSGCRRYQSFKAFLVMKQCKAEFRIKPYCK